MQNDALDTCPALHPILAAAGDGEGFAAVPDPEGTGRTILRAIAGKIGRTRKPGSVSEIPAGATYLAQFAVHDLDMRGRDDVSGAPRLDLALIYGDGPRHDSFAYQVPDRAGEARRRLRIGRARPSGESPAWGAARDLPRTACPHLDARGVESRTEVLAPNAFSDSNLIFGQVQTLWALLHNAVVQRLEAQAEETPDIFAQAQRIVRHVYRQALINDVLGAWLLPDLRSRYVRPVPERLSQAPLAGLPRVFMTGVARLGHGLVREIYALNDVRQTEGLRGLIRHNSLSRPMDMPLTEDWLLDFSRFFDMDGRKAQRARGLGPHVARPFALGGGVGLDAPTPSDGLVLRDLVACARDGVVPRIPVLVDRVRHADAGLLKGCFAQDERRWTDAMAEWLADVEIDPELRERIAADPPLTLFLMLEAEADAGGRSLGALGSVLMAETIVAALPDAAPAEDLDLAERAVFEGPVPRDMATTIAFLQRHYAFPDGARLHAPAAGVADTKRKASRRPMEDPMLDDQSNAMAAGLFEVADYIELGRLVADWTLNEDARPDCIEELRRQLDGIARVPENFKDLRFVEGKPEVLVIRLPERALTDATLRRLESLEVGERYRLPKFYDDIYHRHFGPVMTPLDIFLARMGDYTIAQCQ